MRSRRSPWGVGLLAAGFALSLAAVGCGDDDTSDNGGSGGSGGSTAGKGGTGGSSGKGGSGTAGKSGSGGSGGGTSPSMCISDTTDVFKGQTAAPSAECISCICNENAKATEACDAMAKDCWGLIQCYDAHRCADDQCAIDNCMDFIGGGTAAKALSPVLTGDKCSSKCVVEGTDAGVDAG